MFYSFTKRVFDIVCSGIGLVILLPVGLLIALLVKVSDGGPILYSQIRVGRFGKEFRIWKFRTMVVNADKAGPLLTKAEDRRITRIGRVLRNSKLDELPQLWNVLIGEMSFVGPRPEVSRYVDRYTPAQREVLNYKPGITDIATVFFRNEEALLRGAGNLEQFYVQHCLPRKIDLNRQYAKQAGLLQDIWIIVQTLCPYWLGVLAIYGFALIVSLWLSYQLRFDFHVGLREYAEFVRCLPWIILPQLMLLIWRAQLRGLMSYFSLPEVRRTGSALGLALGVQAVLAFLSRGRLVPLSSVVLIQFVLSFVTLCGVRMGFRMLREGYSAEKIEKRAGTWRIAIIGTGNAATMLARDFRNTGNSRSRVVAFFDDNPRMWQKRPHNIPVIGMPECLLNKEWLGAIDEVIIALPEEEMARVREVGEMLKDCPWKITTVSASSQAESIEARN